MVILSDYVDYTKRVETSWASIPEQDRATILRKVGHRELFAMTASGMTIADITVRFWERLSEAIINELGII